MHMAASVTANWIQLAGLVYKVLNGLSPQYLKDDCQFSTTNGCRQLWSSNITTCDCASSKNLHKSEWSLIHCCWTASVEQPTFPPAWFWTYSLGVPLVTEDATVLLRTVAAWHTVTCFYSTLKICIYITLPYFTCSATVDLYNVVSDMKSKSLDVAVICHLMLLAGCW